MSATAGAWVVLAVTLIVLSFGRPAYAVAFYMMTFFAAPQLWWWGKDVPELRYSAISGLVLLIAVLFYVGQKDDDVDEGHRFSGVHKVALLMVLNVTFVQFAIASRPDITLENWVEFLKFILLFFLMWRAIRDRDDLRLVIMSIALGAAYIGYEVTVNERGDFSGSRLEGVGAPGADSANSLASLMLLTLPLIGSLFVNGAKRHKLTALVAAPLCLNVLLLCNSRGAFLGLIGAGVSFILIARGPTRKQAIKSMALGGVLLFLLLGDPKILDRFATTFVGSEERDNSAASRFQFWQAGLLMLQDYPLGDGGGSFKYVRGGIYLRRILGEDAEDRSLHNGYLTEATDWGIQGFLLRMLFLGFAVMATFRTSKLCRLEGRASDALMGLTMIVAAAGYLIQCFFGSFIGNEWGYWIVAILVRYAEIYRQPAAAVAREGDETTVPSSPVPARLPAASAAATSRS